MTTVSKEKLNREPQHLPHAPSGSTGGVKRQKRILIIDDDIAFLTHAKRRLQAHGYAVSIHEYPSETPVMIRNLNPDIVLLNIRMGGLSEEKLAYLMGAGRRFRHVNILFYAPQEEESLRSAALRYEAQGYIGAGDVPRVCEQVSRFLPN